MKTLSLLAAIACTSGCATYLSERPPILEDKLGIAGKESIGTLATVSDYRVVFVQLDPKAKLCAEASPDNAQQISNALSAAARANTGDKGVGAEFAYAFASVAKQLYGRSHGIQLYRDGSFALCNMYLNGIIEKSEYVQEMKELRLAAKEMTLKQIEKGGATTYDNPSWPDPKAGRPDPIKPTAAKETPKQDEPKKEEPKNEAS